VLWAWPILLLLSLVREHSAACECVCVFFHPRLFLAYMPERECIFIYSTIQRLVCLSNIEIHHQIHSLFMHPRILDLNEKIINRKLMLLYDVLMLYWCIIYKTVLYFISYTMLNDQQKEAHDIIIHMVLSEPSINNNRCAF
jgi:hypothetical protein